MKLNKAAYLSIFFLVCFVSAFSINNFYKLHSSECRISSLKTNAATFAQKENGSSSSSDFLFEENENENEVSYTIVAIILPYIISFSQLECNPLHFTSVNSTSDKSANPIYISVCNFRI